MNITNVKYLEYPTIVDNIPVVIISISATIDGQEFTIPDQADNRHRQMIAEWEAEGNTIAAYVAPSEPAATTKLINRVQFKSMLALLGKEIDDVLTAIDAVITDPTQNVIAKIKVTDSDYYARDNALFSILGPILNLTDEQIDGAWEQAVLI